MNFHQIPYARFDMDAACRTLESLSEQIAAAKSPEAQLALLSEGEELIQHASTSSTLAQLRYFLNTADAFYAGEMAYVGQNSPRFDLFVQKLYRSIAASPFRRELTASLGSFFFEKVEAEARLSDESVLDLCADEQALCQRYTDLTGQATVSYCGEELPLSSMSVHYTDTDRARRREAVRATNAWYEAHAAELDEIFDALVKNRTEQARRLGFCSYTDMKYANRFGFGREQIEAFRAQVLEKWVPFVCEIKENQRKRLGVPSFRLYDSPLRFADGNPRLQLTGDAFVRAVGDVFHQMNREAGAYFDELRQNGMFDLFDRKGKVAYDGFCVELTDYNTDFIFGHFAGDQTDLEVLVHEFGHALAACRARRNPRVPYLLRSGTQEIAETHSTSMELLTLPYLEPFFTPEDLRKYRIKQIEYAAYFICSICVGDEFQHEIYDHPEMTPSERNAAYARIYLRYNPYLDTSDLPFASWGSQWQDMSVIYAMPFYFIDYALAQTQALLFYAESQKDPAGAFQRYLRFVDFAGTRPFPQIVRACGLLSPFDEKCFDALLPFCRELIKG